MSDDFVFCNVNWREEGVRGPHLCANYRPGHEEHRCCCGTVKGNPTPEARAETEGGGRG